MALDLEPPTHLALAVGGEFRDVGEEFLGYFVEFGGLEPHHRVLDVGCGVGRMAMPLTRYLDDRGRYDGFDITEDGVAWCQAEIAARDSRFRFRHVDVHNPAYNTDASVPAGEFRFPYDGAAFDFVCLTSVFTHMRPDGVQHYLREVARVLAPGGRCFATYFLLNEESLTLLRSGLSPVFHFRHRFDGFRSNDADIPENAIAYPEVVLHDWYRACGLTSMRPIYGRWCTRLNGRSLQDLVIAIKT